MDLMNLITQKYLTAWANEFDYEEALKGFIGTQLFPVVKEENIKLAVLRMAQEFTIPVAAQVHALDTEARIGDRPNLEEFITEQFYVKEKLEIGESLMKMKNLAAKDKDIVNAIFKDVNNLITRILTRLEVMAMELVATGEITIKENNVDTKVSYGLPDKQKFTFEGWSNPSTPIISQIEKAQKKSPFKFQRAIMSNEVASYIRQNAQLGGFLKDQYVSNTLVKTWLKENLGFDVVIDDRVYKEAALATDHKRFFPEESITFLTTDTPLGATFSAPTPIEEFGLATDQRGLVAVTRTHEVDPVKLWTIAGGMFVPTPRDISEFWIGKVKK